MIEDFKPIRTEAMKENILDELRFRFIIIPIHTDLLILDHVWSERRND